MWDGMVGSAPRSAPLLDVCVVIVNYNGGALLGDVLRAALSSDGVRLGVVVVDNGSTDGSIEAMEQLVRRFGLPAPARPPVVLRAGANLGFAAGNNLGLYALPARYILLLNYDAIVEPRTIASLVRFMDDTPHAGACGPRLNWPDGRPQSFSHGGDPTPAYLLRRALARRAGRPMHDWGGDLPRQVDWVAGTCLCLRAAALAEVGLLSERIFMYFEDADLCLRMRQRGWRVYFVPTAAMTHHNTPSYADRARRANYYRGLSYFYARHYGRASGLALWALARARLLLGG
jgi:GT2 family glycosyltransferase